MRAATLLALLSAGCATVLSPPLGSGASESRPGIGAAVDSAWDGATTFDVGSGGDADTDSEPDSDSNSDPDDGVGSDLDTGDEPDPRDDDGHVDPDDYDGPHPRDPIVTDDDDSSVLDPPGCPGPASPSTALPDFVYGQNWRTEEFGTYDLTTGALDPIAYLGADAAYPNFKNSAYNPFDNTVTYFADGGKFVNLDVATGEIDWTLAWPDGITHSAIVFDPATGLYLGTRRAMDMMEFITLDPTTGTVVTLNPTGDDALVRYHGYALDCERREFVVETISRLGSPRVRKLWKFDADDGTVLSSGVSDLLLGPIAYDVARDSWFAIASLGADADDPDDADPADGVVTLDVDTWTITPVSEARFDLGVDAVYYDQERGLFWLNCDGDEPYHLCAVSVDTGEVVLRTAVDGLPQVIVAPKP